jgi:hypothetical protein
MDKSNAPKNVVFISEKNNDCKIDATIDTDMKTEVAVAKNR